MKVSRSNSRAERAHPRDAGDGAGWWSACAWQRSVDEAAKAALANVTIQESATADRVEVDSASAAAD
jgi:hypothetical protein